MISIIIPLYLADMRQYATIKRCFDSLKDSGFEGELIVVDDASPITSHEFPTTLRHHDNTGFTRAVNDGLRLATGDILVIANQDIVFTKELLEKFEKVYFGIYSPKTVDEGSGDYFGSIWGMNRKAYQLLGELNPRLAHYFSDKDYYRRAKAKGVPIIKWNLMVEHEGSNAYEHRPEGNGLYDNDFAAYKEIWGHDAN